MARPRLADLPFVVARSASGRPTCCHKTLQTDRGRTICGTDVRGWSRAYYAAPIEVLWCLRCKKIDGAV